MTSYEPAVLLDRIVELERRLKNQRERTYQARKSRDRWKGRALEYAPDARSWRRWKLSYLKRGMRPSSFSEKMQ